MHSILSFHLEGRKYPIIDRIFIINGCLDYSAFSQSDFFLKIVLRDVTFAVRVALLQL